MPRRCAPRPASADRAPVRPNISLGDSLAGLHAAFGAVMALLHRSRSGSAAAGQVVDAAISESMFNMLEGCVAEAAVHGYDRPPSGSTLTGDHRMGKYIWWRVGLSWACQSGERGMLCGPRKQAPVCWEPNALTEVHAGLGQCAAHVTLPVPSCTTYFTWVHGD